MLLPKTFSIIISPIEIGVFAVVEFIISIQSKILFLGMGEEIEITHRAYEKSVFARGALYCAQVLMEKEKGLYTRISRPSLLGWMC